MKNNSRIPQYKSLKDRLTAEGPKRILALDGGGIRGALTLGYLEKIEETLRERHNNPNLLLCDYFDLIGGTSTGAIIAGGLAIGKSAADLKKLYLDLGGKIFSQKNNRFKSFFRGARYNHCHLEKELKANFGDISLGGDEIKTGLCIVTKRADTASIWPVTNNPSAKYFEDNKDILLRDLLRGSSAAPSYFEPKKINVNHPNKEPQYGAFIDGGVSHANNPSLQLFLISQLKGYKLNWGIGDDNLLIISLGTGVSIKKKSYKEFLPKNLMNWGKEIPDLLMEDATFLNQTVMQLLTDSPTAQSIDSEIEFLDKDILSGTSHFTYQRYNEILDEKHLSKLNLSFQVDEKLVESIKEMDRAKHRFQLAEIGIKSAAEQIKKEHFPEVFDLNRSPNKSIVFIKGEKPNFPFKKAIKRPIPIEIYQMNEPFKVKTNEGVMQGKAGDYLMVGVKGEMYPCSKEVFEKTYDITDANNP